MKNPTDPRWRNEAGYETFDCPLRAFAVAALSEAVVDFARFGMKRHRQWCKHGRPWVSRIRRSDTDDETYYSRTPPVYRNMSEKIAWLFSRPFGLMVEVLGLELEQVQECFIKLMAGPPPNE